jgi:hypothetical protein
MKNIFFVVLFIFGLFFLQSCKKEIPTTTTSYPTIVDILNSSNNVHTDHQITLVANDYLWGGNNPVDNLDIRGDFFEKNSKPIDLKIFSIGEYAIPKLPNGQYYLHPEANSVPSNIDVSSALCGKSIEYVIESDNFGKITTNSYIPALLYTTIVSAEEQLIKKSDPLTINWKPDLSVVERDPNQITGAILTYHAGFSINSEQGGLPTQNISISKEAQDASGSLTFSPSELAVFPQNGYITIYCGRAAQTIVTSSNGITIAITNLVHSTSTDMRIQ